MASLRRERGVGFSKSKATASVVDEMSSSDDESSSMNPIAALTGAMRGLDVLVYTVKPATLTNLIYDLILANSHKRRFMIVASFLESYPILKVLSSHLPELMSYVDLMIESYLAAEKPADEVEEVTLPESQAATTGLQDLTKPYVSMACGGVAVIATLLAGTGSAVFNGKDKIMQQTKELAQTINSLGGVFKLVKQSFVSICTDVLGIVPDDPAALEMAGKIQSMGGLTNSLREANELLKQDLSLYFNKSSYFCGLYNRSWELDERCAKSENTTATFRDKYKIFQKSWDDYRDFIRDVVTQTASRPRPATVWLYGPPGHGKSTMALNLVHELSLLEGRQLTSYTYNSGDVYQTGYVGQDVWIFDDFGAVTEAPEVGLFMQLVTEHVFRLNMAALEEKGRIFSSKYIIVTSNHECYCPKDKLTTPSAQLRRRDFVVKVEDPMYDKGSRGHRVRSSDKHLSLTLRSPEGTPRKVKPGQKDQTPLPEFHDIGKVKDRVELAKMLYNRAAFYTQEWHDQKKDKFQTRSPDYPDPSTIPDDEFGEEDTDDQVSVSYSHTSEVEDDDEYESQVGEDIKTYPVWLFIGPPGTGKTTAAKALVGEANVFTECQMALNPFCLDDITLTQERFDYALKKIYQCYAEGPPLIITANESLWYERVASYLTSTGVNSEEAKKELDETLKRRIQRFDFLYKKKNAFFRYTDHEIQHSKIPFSQATEVRFQEDGKYVAQPNNVFIDNRQSLFSVKKRRRSVCQRSKPPVELLWNVVWLPYTLSELKDFSKAKMLDVMKIKYESSMSMVQVLRIARFFNTFMQSIDPSMPYQQIEQLVNRSHLKNKKLPLPVMIVTRTAQFGLFQNDDEEVEALLLNDAKITFKGPHSQIGDILVKGLPPKQWYGYLYPKPDVQTDKEFDCYAKARNLSLGAAASMSVLKLFEYFISLGGTICGVSCIMEAMDAKRAISEFKKWGQHGKPKRAQSQGWADDTEQSWMKVWESMSQHDKDLFMRDRRVKEGLTRAEVSGIAVPTVTKQSERVGFAAVFGDTQDDTSVMDSLHITQQCGDHDVTTCHRRSPEQQRKWTTVFKFVMLRALGFKCEMGPWTAFQEAQYDKKYMELVFEGRQSTGKVRYELYCALSTAYWTLIAFKLKHCPEEYLQLVEVNGIFSPFDTPEFSLLNEYIKRTNKWLAEKKMMHMEVEEIAAQEGYPKDLLDRIIATKQSQSETPLRVSMRLVEGNIRRVRTYRVDGVKYFEQTAWCVGLRDRYYLTPAHVVPENGTYYVEDLEGNPMQAKIAYRAPHLWDFAILFVKDAPAIRNILPHWATQQEIDNMSDFPGFLSILQDEKPFVQAVRYGQQAKIMVDHGESHLRLAMPNFVYVNKLKTEKGDCGSVYFTQQNGMTKACGVHAAAGTNVCFGCMLSRQQLEQILSEASLTILDFNKAVSDKDGNVVDRYNVSKDLFTVSDCNNIATPEAFHQGIEAMKVQKLPYQSVVFFPVRGENGYQGMLSKDGVTPHVPHQPTKTQLHRTPMWDGSELAGEPAILSVIDHRNVDQKTPCANSMNKWMAPAVPLPENTREAIKRAFGYIYDELMSRFSVTRPKIRRLTIKEAINRPTDIPSVNSMEKDSSAGYPWKMMITMEGKKPILKFDKRQNIWAIDTEKKEGNLLQRSLQQLENACFHQTKTAVIFDAILKDEILPLEKVNDVRTRVILAAPLELTILHRQYLAAIGAAVMDLHNQIPIKVGINPYTEWDVLFKNMLCVGVHGLDLDFKNWDTTVPTFCLEQAALLWSRIARAFGMRERDQKIITGIYKQICNPIIANQKDVFIAEKGMPSGQPFTAIDNSVINWAITMAAFELAVYGKIPRPMMNFSRHICLAVYGDDSMMSVQKEVQELFTPQKMVEFAKSLGMEVTSMDKTGQIVDYKPLPKLQFLSRLFSMNTEDHCGLIVGRLKPSSLYKLVGYVKLPKRHYFSRTKPEVVTNQILLQQLVDVACVEMMLVDPTAYTGFCELMRSRLAVDGVTCRFPSFQDVRDETLK